MKTNAHNIRAAGGFMERWTLMEEGRKLHDKAVFKIFAELFTRMGFSKKGSRMAKRGLDLTPSLANNRPL